MDISTYYDSIFYEEFQRMIANDNELIYREKHKPMDTKYATSAFYNFNRKSNTHKRIKNFKENY